MAKATWGTADIPDLTGKWAVVTGGSGGLGYQTALEIARRGGSVTLGCRDVGRGNAAAERIRGAAPGARVAVAPLDLADLSSVRAFAERYAGTGQRLDILVNNAGILGLPRTLTVDGHESHFAVNY